MLVVEGDGAGLSAADETAIAKSDVTDEPLQAEIDDLAVLIDYRVVSLPRPHVRASFAGITGL
jgi:hypothetical protein